MTIGALWLVQSGPLWQHALRLSLIVLVVAPLAHLVQSRRRSRGEQSHGPRPSLPRLVAAKIALLVIAVIGTWLLTPVLPHTEIVVTLAVAVIIAVLGPVLHPYMLLDQDERRRTG
ncbi:hypothetical protein [Streptomyces fuscichromogenes]|uniref:hypothetical protein n=1 Tax=Streptomyces fuscichromogenes TaxID=1324013 RepID=UPI00166FAB54|nr:hypothetical protein [Streptomyces fuscichromogenes]